MLIQVTPSLERSLVLNCNPLNLLCAYCHFRADVFHWMEPLSVHETAGRYRCSWFFAHLCFFSLQTCVDRCSVRVVCRLYAIIQIVVIFRPKNSLRALLITVTFVDKACQQDKNNLSFLSVFFFLSSVVALGELSVKGISHQIKTDKAMQCQMACG